VVVEGLSERLIIVCNIYSPVSRLTAEQEAFYEKLGEIIEGLEKIYQYWTRANTTWGF